MSEIGYLSLLLAFVAAIYTAIAFAFGERWRRQALLNGARTGLLATCGLVSLSVIILLYALISHQFQLEYVASYTSRDLGLPYLISALWAGNSGSLLFWAWLLSIFAAFVLLQKRSEGRRLVPYTSMVMMLTQAFFLLLLLLVANPFQKLTTIPADGMGLNPMLENPGMIIHPPVLLAGYVAFTVPFAFAIATLMKGGPGDEWVKAIRRWTLIAWLFLGAGNLIGAWWAYVELGWGGYWAWDAVENAGLMPWLVATAFLHSLIMQKRMGMLKVWSMVLIVLTFNLAIFGTFLTRSGVLSSVHTFGESSLGPFFIAFLGISLVGSFSLLYYRRKELKSDSEMESMISRESTFLINNLLLVGSAVVIFFGTMFPLISETIQGVKVNIGQSFFDQVNGPIFLAIIVLAGICTLIGWRRASAVKLARSFLWPLVTSLILSAIIFAIGVRAWYALIAFFLCMLVFFSILYEWFNETRARHSTSEENYLSAFGALLRANTARYGAYLIHIAIILIAFGIIGSSFFEVEKEAILKTGDSMTIGKYTLVYEKVNHYQTPSKLVVGAELSIYNNRKFIGRLTPEKYFHRSYEQPVTEVAIRTSPMEDLYVILGTMEEKGTTFKVLINPLVVWIWIGGGVLILGGVLTFWPERAKITPVLADAGVLKTQEDVEQTVEKGAINNQQEKRLACRECGAPFRERDIYCSYCGVRLKTNTRRSED